MKLMYRFVLLAFISAVFFGPSQQASAQALDTMLVTWSDDGINPVENRLRNVILADTLADGSHVQNRVYKLERGGFYWNNDRITNTGFHLRIVGETPDPGDPVFGNPATLQLVTNDEGQVDSKIIDGSGDLTLKNLYIIGADDDGVQTSYQPIELSGEGRRYLIDNVIFERTNFALIAFTNPGNDIYFTNCVFRNLIGRPSTQQWEGRGTSIWIDQDTVVVENCTFFNVHMTALQIEGGSANYVRFNHNTIVNLGRNVNTGNWWQEAYLTNNLIVNGFWHGEGNADLSDPNRDPRATSSGLFSIGTLPSIYGPEEGRRVAIANNSSYRNPAFTAYYADTIMAQPFLNPVSREDFVEVLEKVVVRDTIWADPQLATTFSSEQYNLMIQNIEELRAGITPATDYMWMIPQLPDMGGDCHTCPSWPLPEDFTYTNPMLLTAGTDGLPLGDLNWFPAQKEQWEQNKDQYIKDIEDIPGGRVVFDIVGTIEAEDGSVAGGAAVEEFQGFSFVQMRGGGFFEWDFDMAAATTVDLIVYTRSNDQQRGERIIVNGTNIRNNSGFGEYFWDSLTPEFQPFLITQADLIEGAEALNLNAGQNTLRVEHSWGFQDFVGFDVLEAGTSNIIHELRPPNITDFAIVELLAEGAPWTPSAFKFVALNGGSLSLPVDAPESGMYRLSVFYQAPDGSQLVDIDADGQTVLPSVELPGVAGDSTGSSILTSSFALTAGAHTISLTGNQVNIDFVQFILERVTGLNPDDQRLRGFDLAQNYPNPFNPTTTIVYNLPQRSEVTLQVYNVLGQQVRALVKNQKQVAGRYTIEWDGKDDAGRSVASGIYFYRLKAGDFVKSLKMMLIK